MMPKFNPVRVAGSYLRDDVSEDVLQLGLGVHPDRDGEVARCQGERRRVGHLDVVVDAVEQRRRRP